MKKITDYDLKNFNSFDKFGRRFKIEPDAMWSIYKNKLLDAEINKWLNVDNSERSKEKLFSEMFYEVFHNKAGQDILNKLLDYFPKDDRYCAFVWSALPNKIPISNGYKYISTLSLFMEQFQYKEFKRSIVEHAIEYEAGGFMLLLRLKNKNIINTDNAIKILGNRNLFNEMLDLLTHLKTPEKFNKKSLELIEANIKALDFNGQGSVDINNRKKLTSFLNSTLEKYKDENIGTPLLKSLDNASDSLKNMMKSNGIYQLLLNNKLEHEMISYPTKNKTLKI